MITPTLQRARLFALAGITLFTPAACGDSDAPGGTYSLTVVSTSNAATALSCRAETLFWINQNIAENVGVGARALIGRSGRELIVNLFPPESSDSFAILVSDFGSDRYSGSRLFEYSIDFCTIDEPFETCELAGGFFSTCDVRETLTIFDLQEIGNGISFEFQEEFELSGFGCSLDACTFDYEIRGFRAQLL